MSCSRGRPESEKHGPGNLRGNLLPSFLVFLAIFYPLYDAVVTLPCIRRDQPDLKYILLLIPCCPPCTLDSFLPTSTPPLTRAPAPLKGRASLSLAAPESKTHVFDGNWPSLPVSVATRLKKPPLRIHLLICIGFQQFLRHPRKTTLRKDLKPGPAPVQEEKLSLSHNGQRKREECGASELQRCSKGIFLSRHSSFGRCRR